MLQPQNDEESALLFFGLGDLWRLLIGIPALLPHTILPRTASRAMTTFVIVATMPRPTIFPLRLP